jgi:hypothetical protein
MAKALNKTPPPGRLDAGFNKKQSSCHPGLQQQQQHLGLDKLRPSLLICPKCCNLLRHWCRAGATSPPPAPWELTRLTRSSANSRKPKLFASIYKQTPIHRSQWTMSDPFGILGGLWTWEKMRNDKHTQHVICTWNRTKIAYAQGGIQLT